jgi:hypothetical protein
MKVTLLSCISALKKMDQFRFSTFADIQIMKKAVYTSNFEDLFNDKSCSFSSAVIRIHA